MLSLILQMKKTSSLPKNVNLLDSKKNEKKKICGLTVRMKIASIVYLGNAKNSKAI